MRSPEFHQIDIVNGSHEWQKNEGDYFPEWLREISVALISPVPSLAEVLKQVNGADVKNLGGITHYSWMTISTDGNTQKGMGAAIAIADSTGLLEYGSDIGWSGDFSDYQNFHGRTVAHTVSSGTPEVTAKVITLEDLRDIPATFFDTDANGGDAQLLRTEVVEETSLRKNLLPREAIAWPPLQDGPLEGGITTEIVVDRTGKVQDVASILSDNPGLSETARRAIAAMQFKPYLLDGTAVQVVSRITMPFKTVRPAGVETFESARTYFEHGRSVGFPAAGNSPPYLLHASFKAGTKAGTVQDGQYVDTWNSNTEWRREATIGTSRYIRARYGDKLYKLVEGPDAPLLQLVLQTMEPIPAIDTFVESDWRIKRDTVDGVSTVRVLAGYESPNGTLDPERARGYWFDDSGKLVKTFSTGLETRRSEFEEFGGIEVAREIRVFQNNQLAMFIQITQLSSAAAAPENTFELRGHEWTGAFTAEVR